MNQGMPSQGVLVVLRKGDKSTVPNPEKLVFITVHNEDSAGYSSTQVRQLLSGPEKSQALELLGPKVFEFVAEHSLYVKSLPRLRAGSVPLV